MNDLQNVGLDQEAKELIDAARDMHEPSARRRARVRRAIEAELAGGIGLAVLHASSALALPAKIVAATIVLGAATTGAWLVRGHVTQSRTQPPVASAAITSGLLASGIVGHTTAAPEAAPLLARETPPSDAVEGPLHPAASAPRSTRATGPAVRESDSANGDTAKSLAAETSLLEQANAAVRAGEGGRALALLGDYDKQYRSGGVLFEERSAAEVLALCLVGRDDQARAKARTFLTRWPRSPLVRRLNASCAGDAPAR